MSAHKKIVVFVVFLFCLWCYGAFGAEDNKTKNILDHHDAVISEIRKCILSNFNCRILVETHRMQDRFGNFIECLDKTIRPEHVYSIKEQYVIDEFKKGVWMDFYQQDGCPKFIVTYVPGSTGLPQKVDVGVVLN